MSPLAAISPGPAAVVNAYQSGNVARSSSDAANRSACLALSASRCRSPAAASCRSAACAIVLWIADADAGGRTAARRSTTSGRCGCQGAVSVNDGRLGSYSS